MTTSLHTDAARNRATLVAQPARSWPNRGSRRRWMRSPTGPASAMPRSPPLPAPHRPDRRRVRRPDGRPRPGRPGRARRRRPMGQVRGYIEAVAELQVARPGDRRPRHHGRLHGPARSRRSATRPSTGSSRSSSGPSAAGALRADRHTRRRRRHPAGQRRPRHPDPTPPPRPGLTTAHPCPARRPPRRGCHAGPTAPSPRRMRAAMP